MPERRATVETEAGNAHNGELHRQHVALLAVRIVTGGLVNSSHFTVRKRAGVEACRLQRVLVEPEADCVLGLHVRVSLCSIRAQRSTGRIGSVTGEGMCGPLQSMFQIARPRPTFLNISLARRRDPKR